MTYSSAAAEAIKKTIRHEAQRQIDAIEFETKEIFQNLNFVRGYNVIIYKNTDYTCLLRRKKGYTIKLCDCGLYGKAIHEGEELIQLRNLLLKL